MSISLVIVLRTRYFLQQPTKAKKGKAGTSWTIGKRNSFFCRRNACLAADTTLFVDYLCDFGEYNYCIMFWNKFWIEERLKIYFDTILHVIGPRLQIHKSGLINIGPRLQLGDNKRCTYRKNIFFRFSSSSSFRSRENQSSEENPWGKLSDLSSPIFTLIFTSNFGFWLWCMRLKTCQKT